MAAYRGKFVPQNKEKYRGNWKDVTYRSSWELMMFKRLDNDPSVKWWNSEGVVIPYISPADGGKRRRYFVDIAVQYNNGDKYLFEIKPAKETRPPNKPAKLTAKAKQKFLNEHYNWEVNKAKWTAALKLSEQKNWKFKIITEDTLKAMGFKI